ncbi:DUF6286 domain-containing protein [Quadrisphaera sp. DSM 44207]|uniref:DUF6286 domain-containing protein n=1 Tax=Quadrisphaera sp. DSM 44207 TaxID=1881057 RepID=UPI00088780DB|nr:DUF6286 domain-containing protein [Quadrisphaera sp. DSM 44207]SDQ85547.1 hypothetical protein SAMN05428996_2908 [Quadrisphaera sp. DSM 44207]
MSPVAVLNRVLSALLALALLLGGLLAVVEVVLAQLGRPSWLVPHEQWASWLDQRTWDQPVVQAVLAGLVVLGLLLLLAALRRGRPSSLPLAARGGGTPAGVRVTASRRGIERTLAAAARRAPGVSRADARVSRRKAVVRARTALRSEGDLQQRVTANVAQRLEELGLSGTLRPQVSLTREESR